ncbi:MAG: NAD(P)/FAD-dependent oxidoreductase [Anaerolineales bacterium]|nr:NAD(P)/FAD-dependent oxidoreductase [Anaerolineales bacterium]
MKYDAIIVGAGIAGLTAGAYLSKAGYSTLLCEKEAICGGLVNTFERDGFFYDGGIRATENSGVLFPMLKQLGLEIEFVKNKITLGVEDTIIPINTVEDLSAYQALLNQLYPENIAEIDLIVEQIQQIMKYMDVQYSIDNPAFLDLKEDWEYMLKKIVPWMFQYAFTFKKIEALNEPVEDFLRRYTDNQSLLDIIAQHFFKQTPAFFALSYIKLYQDYYYPLGGTGTLIRKMTHLIKAHGGEIRNKVLITKVDPEKKLVTTSEGDTLEYQQLIWAADLKALYRSIDPASLQDNQIKSAFKKRWTEIEDKTGNDSIFTLFLGVDLDKSYFAGIASEHLFYTASKKGESAAGPLPIGKDKETVKQWLADFLSLTTYEIACPVLRDVSMAPEGKTGLVISVLFDYQLTKYIQESGWYEEFKAYAETCMIKTLSESIYPGIAGAIVQQFSSTPLTMEKISGNTHGAITGWAFSNRPMPAESRLPKIFSATKTPIPGIFQAGQWTYSPSGLPISILTGKLAADSVIKELG